MKREFWLLCAYVEPFRCNKVHETIALSEPFEKFVARNIRVHKEFSHFAVTSITEIDERRYKVLKVFNPTNEGYFHLIRNDYSKVVHDEDDEKAAWEDDVEYWEGK